LNWAEEKAVIVSMMLIAAVLASLALGVLVAYGLCQAMFRIFRVHSMSMAKEPTGVSVARAVAKG
jgi:hypothetical protein